MDRRYNLDTDKHRGSRAILRVIGPLLVVIGGVLTLIGCGGFFSAFGSGPSVGGPPAEIKLFFLCFVGMPLMAVGMTVCKFAFMGSVARYVASEAAPVAKDATNYMIDGTKGAIGDLTQSVAAGLAGGLAGQQAQGDEVPCPACGNACDSGARFCDPCATRLENVAFAWWRGEVRVGARPGQQSSSRGMRGNVLMD